MYGWDLIFDVEFTGHSKEVRLFLRRIWGHKRDEITGGRRKLHNEVLHNLYFSPNIIRMSKSRMSRAFRTHMEKRNAYGVLVGKAEGNRPLRRPRHRYEGNIKMDLREI
jgi:hypothetical protein